MDCIFPTSFIVWSWVWKHWYMQWGESMGGPFGSRNFLESTISEPLVLFWVFWKQIFKVLARYKAWWPCLFSLCVFLVSNIIILFFIWCQYFGSCFIFGNCKLGVYTISDYTKFSLSFQNFFLIVCVFPFGLLYKE